MKSACRQRGFRDHRRASIWSARCELRTRRAGYSLVLFAMLLFGLMAMTGLVIDVGFARLTQRQMQQAVTAAAIEGLSKSDVDPTNVHTYASRTPATETARRQAAADFVTAVFDDDFDAVSDDFQFGAGPDVEFSGGIELNDGFVASQTITTPAVPVYKPELQLNSDNDADGDLVTGPDWMRVRLRRTGGPAESGVTSDHAAIPLLFARGSLVGSRRKSIGIGLDVDATAEVRPVVRVGIRQVIPRPTEEDIIIPGAIPFAVRRDIWESLPANSATPATTGTECGRLAEPATVIGRPAVLLADAVDADGYCAVIDNASRVIGFGWANVDPGNPGTALITKHRDSGFGPSEFAHTVAPENATARLSAAWDSLESLDGAARAAVIEANRNLIDPLVSAVPVPER